MAELWQPGQMGEGKWTQQVHAGCGGEIVIIVQVAEKRMAACCKGCRSIWHMPQIVGWPDNWQTPGQSAPLIVLPGGAGRVL